MKPSFSEFQFAYSVTRELDDNPARLFGLPYIPNQREEALHGYDVAFPNGFIPLFLQFKLAERLIQPNANQWNDFNRSYFRFNIYPDNRSHQHNSLRQLALSDSNFLVCYCAPLFIEFQDLMQYHLNFPMPDFLATPECTWSESLTSHALAF